MSTAPTQTKAQRLAALIGRYRSPHCGEAAALLLRQDELLKQALEALDGMLQIYGVHEKTLPPASSVEIECCDYARQAKSAICAHREAK